MGVQTIGYDKINQLRHVKFFKSVDGLKEHMKKHANYLRPKFDVTLAGLERGLGGLGIGCWTNPNGGYFISYEGLPGTAKRCVQLCAEAGVKLTNAGSVYPYGKDPEDKNIRIAPSYPTTEQLYQSINVFCICQKIAALESLDKDE
jgi:DNA-binding transcriptional MocR family regulator